MAEDHNDKTGKTGGATSGGRTDIRQRLAGKVPPPPSLRRGSASAQAPQASPALRKLLTPEPGKPARPAAGKQPAAASRRMPPPPPPPPPPPALRTRTGQPGGNAAAPPAGSRQSAAPRPLTRPSPPPAARQPARPTGAPSGARSVSAHEQEAGAGSKLDANDFAARLRAQREAAERLMGKRAESTSSAPATPSSSTATAAPEPGVVAAATTRPAQPPAASSPVAPATSGIAMTGAGMASGKAASADAPEAGHAATPPIPTAPARGPAVSPDATASGAARPDTTQAAAAAAEAASASLSTPGTPETGASAVTMPPASVTPVQAPPAADTAQTGHVHADAPAGPGTPAYTALHHEPAPAPDALPPEAGSYAEVYDQLQRMEAQEPPRRMPMMMLLAIFLGIAVLAALAVFLFYRMQPAAGTAQGGKNLPVIEAPGKPAKVKPADVPSAAPATGQRRRKLIYDRIIDDGAGDQKKTQEAPRQEATPPAATTPTPAPPPLPPPPSLGDDQGKAPQQPEGMPGTPGDDTDTERTAMAQGNATVTPAGGGKPDASRAIEHKREHKQAVAAGGGELAQAVKAFAARDVPHASDNTGMTTGSVAMAGSKPAALESGKPSDIKPVVQTKAKAKRVASGGQPRKEAAARRKVARHEGKARPAAHRPPPAVAGKTRDRKIDKGKTTRQAAARPPIPPVPPATSGRAGKGPIPLPGAVPAPAAASDVKRVAQAGRRAAGARSTSEAVRSYPAGARPVPAPEAPVVPRKRTNFSTVKIGGRPASTVPENILSTAAPAAASAVRPGTPTQARQPAAAPRRMASLAPARRNAAAPQPRASRAGASGGGYVVQLAAFRSQQDAQRAWQRIRGKHGGILGGLQPIITRKNLGGAGTFYRLSIGPVPSRQAANRLCQRLIARGEPDCLIRKR